MKKTLLLLALCIAGLYIHAQTDQRSLLYGKWQLYSMNYMGHTWTRDSVEVSMKSLMASFDPGPAADTTARTDSMPGDSTRSDAIKMIDIVRTSIDAMFSLYMVFDKNGNVKTVNPSKTLKDGKVFEQTGTYRWSGPDKLIIKYKKTTPGVPMVINLTEDKLSLKIKKKGLSENGKITFVRVN